MNKRMLWIVAAAALVAGCMNATDTDRQKLASGYTFYEGRQYDRSEASASEFITKFPNDPNVDEAYYLRGLSRLGRGDHPGAAQDLNTAIAKSQRNDLKAKSYKALGDMSFDAQRWEQAIDYFQSSLKFYPSDQPDASVLYRLGASTQALGQWGQAKPYFDRTAKLAKDPYLRQRALNRAATTHFSLQFAAFSARATADTEARRLQSLGVRAVVVPELGETALMFTVRAGIFHDYATADESRRQMLAKFPVVRISP